ncbi:HNH endonuclease [Lysinibacillus sp. K60]|uniref:HNH endonuclease n=1 Tax=Lysinibacillus sp. K60 TaxID=2720027 RepID=UPI001C8BCB32|nr:hypothetical protein [Lysinibacillus sp. K60]MBX8945338.1 hypothetical protein [Lysinibacillus sp. K60]
MLFGYKYISHSLEKVQEYIDFLFLEIWVKAEGEFDIEKLNDLPEFKDLLLDIQKGRVTNDYLLGPISRIYNHFKNLSEKQLNDLRMGYIKNNSIEELCANVDGYEPLTYKDIEGFNKDLAGELKTFFINLFEHVIHLSDVKKKIGTINDHYKQLVGTNNIGICPFCGLNEIKGSFSSKREAYDHFLPKSTYAFNSINMKNLAPICHECNSSYKLAKNPLYSVDKAKSSKIRRKAFFPFTEEVIDISVNMELNSSNIENLQGNDIELNIQSQNFKEETETWKDIFGIEERYKDKIIKGNGAYYWYSQVTQEFSSYMSPKEALELIKTMAENNKFAEQNFLKVAFLEACDKRKLIG